MQESVNLIEQQPSTLARLLQTYKIMPDRFRAYFDLFSLAMGCVYRVLSYACCFADSRHASAFLSSSVFSLSLQGVLNVVAVCALHGFDFCDVAHDASARVVINFWGDGVLEHFIVCKLQLSCLQL